MNRTALIVSVVAAFLLGLGGRVLTERLGAQPAEVTPVVKAGRFVLVDAQGNKRAVLGFDGAGQPNLSIYDERGRTVWSTRSGVVPAREP